LPDEADHLGWRENLRPCQGRRRQRREAAGAERIGVRDTVGAKSLALAEAVLVRHLAVGAKLIAGLDPSLDLSSPVSLELLALNLASLRLLHSVMPFGLNRLRLLNAVCANLLLALDLLRLLLPDSVLPFNLARLLLLDSHRTSLLPLDMDLLAFDLPAFDLPSLLLLNPHWTSLLALDMRGRHLLAFNPRRLLALDVHLLGFSTRCLLALGARRLLALAPRLLTLGAVHFGLVAAFGAAMRPRIGRPCDRQRGNARGEKHPGHHNFSSRTATTVRLTHRSNH
jgi:hypothetical protein